MEAATADEARFNSTDSTAAVKIERPESMYLDDENTTTAFSQPHDISEVKIEPSEVVYVKMELSEEGNEQEDDGCSEDIGNGDSTSATVSTSQCGSTEAQSSATDNSKVAATPESIQMEETSVKAELRCKKCNVLIATEEALVEQRRPFYKHCGLKHCVCVVCFNAYTNSTYLTQHYQRHHLNIRPYVCEICNKEFSSDFDVARHKNNVHLKLKPFECTICQKKFALKPNLLSHQRSVHFKIKSFNCDICKKGFSRKNKLVIHISRMHKAFSCDLCTKTFDLEDQLRHHLNTVHNGIGAFTCFVCNKGFDRKNSLVVHQRFVHLQYKPHTCELCGKSFNIKSHLGDHMAVHLRETFTCQVCDKSFSQKRTLTMHMKRNHNSNLRRGVTPSVQVHDLAGDNKNVPHEPAGGRRPGDSLQLPHLNPELEIIRLNWDEP